MWALAHECVSAHGGFGHLMSCRLISPYSAQMACDYTRLSRDYCVAEIGRETQRAKINSSNEEKVATIWNEKMKHMWGQRNGAWVVMQLYPEKPHKPFLLLTNIKPFNYISSWLYSFCAEYLQPKVTSLDFICCITVKRKMVRKGQQMMDEEYLRRCASKHVCLVEMSLARDRHGGICHEQRCDMMDNALASKAHPKEQHDKWLTLHWANII